MKICILTTSFPAYKGHFQSPFIYELSKHIVKNKLGVDVVCPFYKESKKKFEEWGGVKIHRFQYFYPRNLQKLTAGGGIPSNLNSSLISKVQFPFFLLSMFMKTRKVAKRCDIIHAQWALSALIGVFFKKWYKKPLILTTRGAAVNLALKNWLSKKVLKWILNNCDYICPNNYAHENVLQRLGVSQKKIKTIPNGVAVDLFIKREKIKMRKQLKLPQDNTIIFSIGWLIPRKGYNYLIDALPNLIKKYPKILVLIIGGGIEHDSLTKQAKKLNVKEHIRFVRQRPLAQVAPWMSASDMFILPSLSEGRPNVIPEALLAGIPVIATAVDGTKEFIEHRQNGLLIKPKSAKEIEKAVTIMMEDKKLREKIKTNSRKSVIEKKLGWDDCAKEFVRVYDKILK